MSSQWKLVPVEPTETMVINGFESVPDEFFTDEKVWEQYQEMSGCQQAAFRAKLCWAAMIAAAPAPDIHIAALEEPAGVDFGIAGRSVRVSQEAYSIFLAREAAGREKIAALQQRLTAADERVDVLVAVEYQYRQRPLWRKDDNSGWMPWMGCSPEVHANYTASPELHYWQYETRTLYAGPNQL